PAGAGGIETVQRYYGNLSRTGCRPARVDASSPFPSIGRNAPSVRSRWTLLLLSTMRLFSSGATTKSSTHFEVPACRPVGPAQKAQMVLVRRALSCMFGKVREKRKGVRSLRQIFHPARMERE